MLVYLGQKNDTHTLSRTHSLTHTRKQALTLPHTRTLSERGKRFFTSVRDKSQPSFFISILLEVFLETATQEKLET